jgi:hypothetical protein
MKRKLMYAAGLVLMAMAFTQCEKSCKICQQNTYDASSDALITSGSETEYCGASLTRIEITGPVTVAGITTKWVCR